MTKQLCEVCSQLEMNPSYLEKQILGTFDELLVRSISLGPGCGGCGGCKFFCNALQNSNRWRKRVSELSDRIIVFHCRHLYANASLGPIERIYDGDLRFDVCVEKGKLGDLVFRKRPLPHPDPRDSSCFELVAKWIRQCKTHAQCSFPASVALPKRIIEIPADPSASPRLRATFGETGQYVILSHCWGSKGISRLTKDSLVQFQEAMKLELLPRSFKDAIDVTRRLGFRYLWIDALCIIQDSAEDWAQEAGNMAAYYGLSTLMIAACSAEDSSKGILTKRDVSTFYSPTLGMPKKYCLATYKNVHFGKRKRYCLRQSLLQTEWGIEESVLGSRGWTAQERMLAPRILHYTKRQMIWECAEGLAYEASEQEVKRKTPIALTPYSKLHLQSFVTRALRDTGLPFRGLRYDAIAVSEAYSSGAPLQRLNLWHRCLTQYSPRRLTVATDKLHAIAGVARILNIDGELGDYLAGIWSAHLKASLSWNRRLGPLSKPPVYTGPSWSWAGVIGGVRLYALRSCELNLLPTPTQETEKTWARDYDFKLVDHHMVLQDERNIYGAVLEGSYLVVEGACVMLEGFRQLLDIFKIGPQTDDLLYEMSLDTPGGNDSPNREAEEHLDPKCRHKDAVDLLQRLSHEAVPFDFCMFLSAEKQTSSWKWANILLLSWVNCEANVAQRVGILRLRVYHEEYDLEWLYPLWQDLGWVRWTLKLV